MRRDRQGEARKDAALFGFLIASIAWRITLSSRRRIDQVARIAHA
jgi:hypothetical protein